MNEDYLIIGGGALKSLSDSGKVGGYLVLFDEEDLEGDVFTKSTDFWLEGKSLLPLLWKHGTDKTIGRRRLTHVYHNVQNEGVWIEGKLPLRSSAEIDAIWNLVQLDKVGLSSGSASHLVEKQFNATKKANEIKSWCLTEASLTSTPCQPKSRAVALKSLPAADFESLTRSKNLSAEQTAREIYVEMIKSQYERSMEEFRRSQHGDSRSEETDYYSAMANLELYRCEQRRRQLEKMKR